MRREAILSGCFFSYVNQVVRIAVLFLLCFYGNIGSWISLSIKLFPEKKRLVLRGVGVVQGQHQCAVPPHHKVGNFWELPIRVSSGFDYS